jgi:hypothetical protein
LPIAHYYYTEHGDEIYWPICEEFIPHFERHVPWVTWLPCIDKRGLFFYDEPVQLLEDVGVEDTLYLYQYLSSHPHHTDPELFSILKFDQYKYWVAEVPFLNKWRLQECILRDLEAERKLKEELGIRGEYAVVHLQGSSYTWRGDLGWLGDLPIIDIASHPTASIFDWIGIIEGASAFVGVDSAVANMVDCLGIKGPDLYWIRRSAWDVTPVLGGRWTMVPNEEIDTRDPVRVDLGGGAAAGVSHIISRLPEKIA